MVFGLRLCETLMFLPVRGSCGLGGPEGPEGSIWALSGSSWGAGGGSLACPDQISGFWGTDWAGTRGLRSCQAIQPLCAPGRAKHCSQEGAANSLDGGYQRPRLANEGKQWLRTQFQSITSGRGILLSYCLAYIYFG